VQNEVKDQTLSCIFANELAHKDREQFSLDVWNRICQNDIHGMCPEYPKVGTPSNLVTILFALRDRPSNLKFDSWQPNPTGTSVCAPGRWPVYPGEARAKIGSSAGFLCLSKCFI
jgi:hypothetical protein